MIRKTFLLVSIFIIISASYAFSANHYVRAGANGNGSGSDWTNAYSQLPATLVRGDTYYIADGTYPGYTFDDSTSGSTYVYIKKAIASDHGTNSGWQNSFGDGQAVFTGELSFRSSYYSFDGQTGGGPGSWETNFGFKVDRSAARGDAKCIRIDGSYIAIRHADLENPGEDVTGRADNVYSTNSDHVTISHCWIHSTNRTCFLMNGTTNLVIEYSLISERHATDGTHGELISMNYCGMNANNVFRYNIFRNGYGTGVVVIKDSVQGGWEIYGNLFFITNHSRYNVRNGIITDTTGDTTTNVKIYNNTFLRHTVSGGSTIPPTVRWNVSNGNDFINNIVIDSGGFRGVENRDYNLHTSQTHSSQEPYGQFYQDGLATLFRNPNNYDYSLRMPTEAADSSIGSKFDTDLLGIQRGSDGNWDRGAYEFGGTTAVEPTSPPSTPPGLRIASQ